MRPSRQDFDSRANQEGACLGHWAATNRTADTFDWMMESTRPNPWYARIVGLYEGGGRDLYDAVRAATAFRHTGNIDAYPVYQC